MNLPTISSYGNYGAHTLQVDFENFRLFYSYKTLVVYYDATDGLVCSNNAWGITTGRHLNWIEPNKKNRVENGKFNLMLKEMLERGTN